MNVGLFGGTFNPIHLGHLRAAEEMREQCGLERVIFIPAFLPPHKKTPLAEAGHRLAMVQTAVADNPAFAVSDVELLRQGSSYTCDTIEYFQDRFAGQARLVFIMGSDAFQEIATWRAYPDFFDLCDFAVMSRTGASGRADAPVLPPDMARQFRPGAARGQFVNDAGREVLFCHIPLLEISSSQIRTRCHAGTSIRYLVPPAVSGYIDRHGLYRSAPRPDGPAAQD